MLHIKGANRRDRQKPRTARSNAADMKSRGNKKDARDSNQFTQPSGHRLFLG